MLPTFYDPMPDFSAINRSLAWATDFTLPKMLDDVFRTVISHLDDDTPLVVVAYEALNNITGYNKRLNVAYRLQDKLMEYLKSYGDEKENVERQSKEFKSLLNYLQVLDSACHYSESINKLYNDNADKPISMIDMRVYLFTIIQKDHHDDFLCFSQLLYNHKHQTEQIVKPEQLPIYAYLYRDRIIARPAMNFCISLLECMTYIKSFRSKDKECSLVTVREFPIELRNYCFDQYINICSFEDLKVLIKDNDRQNAPNMYDAEIELLKKEVESYKQAMESHVDDNVLRMTGYFIGCLRDTLGFDNPQEEVDPMSEELNIPNKNYEIDRRIKAVFKAKVCKHKADWAVIFKILVEDGFYAQTDYTAAATRINRACGKSVTTASAIRQSPILSSYSGTWKSGWGDRVHNSRSANLLNHYESIARVYTRN